MFRILMIAGRTGEEGDRNGSSRQPCWVGRLEEELTAISKKKSISGRRKKSSGSATSQPGNTPVVPSTPATAPTPCGGEAQTPAALRDAVKAEQENFLTFANKVREIHKKGVVLAFRKYRFADTKSVLTRRLEDWAQGLVERAYMCFGNMRSIATKHEPDLNHVRWAEAQTRSVLDEAFGTTWFSTAKEGHNRKVESRAILAWLRDIDETLSPPGPPAPLPDGSDDKAWFVQRVNWHAHGWLVGYLPHLVEVRARLGVPYSPIEVLPDNQRDRVVEEISLDLLSGIEKGFKHEVNKVLVYEAGSSPAAAADGNQEAQLRLATETIKTANLALEVVARERERAKAAETSQLSGIPPTPAGPPAAAAPSPQVAPAGEADRSKGTDSQQPTPAPIPSAMSTTLAKRVAVKLENPSGNPTMTVKEVAHAFSTSRSSIYRWVVEGKLNWVSPGKISTQSVKHLLSKPE